MSESSYDRLHERLRTIRALEEVREHLHWDQETMMPTRGRSARAEHVAAIERALHAQRTAPELADLIAEVDDAQADPIQKANLRLAKRMVNRAQKRPAELMAELARQTSLAHKVWADARAASDFAAFAPTLKTLVALKREEATCLGFGEHMYDALLDEFEPGARTSELTTLFDRLRPRLVDLLDRILGAEAPPPLAHPPISTERQVALGVRIAKAIGYDFDAGRMDLAVHPFCSGGVPGDVRITTRANPDSLEDCLYASIHEAGHAMYEQGIDPAMELSPAGQSVSMGVHESQSRLWENAIGRSKPFAEWLMPVLREQLDVPWNDPDAFYRSVNRVQRGCIRVEADEVTYNLHILLRFDIERLLISGELDVNDLEDTWNGRMESDLGIRPKNAAEGVLQDVHWSVGAWGYFPSYTLGNIYAAELSAAMGRAIPNLEEAIRTGQFNVPGAWLREHVHQHGSIMPSVELVEQAIGHAPSEKALLTYLEEKMGVLYGL